MRSVRSDRGYGRGVGTKKKDEEGKDEKRKMENVFALAWFWLLVFLVFFSFLIFWHFFWFLSFFWGLESWEKKRRQGDGEMEKGYGEMY